MGFVLRVAELNGYDTPRHVHAVAEIPRGLELAAGFPVERLSEVLGQDPSTLRGIAYREDSEKRRAFKILNRPLGDGLRNAPLRLRHPAFCPQCAQEDGYIDTFYDLTVAVACPRHQRMVTRACPVCAMPLSWIRPGILKCRCGGSLAAAEVVAADPEVAELMALLYARLHQGTGCSLENFSGLPAAQLQAMPLSALVRMLQILGAHALCVTELDSRQSQPAAARAAKVLADWPHGYHKFLATLGGELLRTQPEALGLRKQFSRFYASMFKNRVFSVHAGFLREEFIRFGHQEWGAAYVDTKLFGRDEGPKRTRFMTPTQVARRLRIWKPTMERMIADGTLVTREIGAGPSTRKLIDLDESQLPEASEVMLSAREAAASLEIPVSVLKELRRRGIYTITPHRGRANSFTRYAVEALRHRAMALPATTASTPRRQISITELMRLKLRSASAKADIVAAVLAGDIAVVGRERDSVGGLLVDASQVDRLVLGQRCEHQGGVYTLSQCAKATGLAESTIKNAIQEGLLNAIAVQGEMRVPQASVDAFNGKYVTLSSLACRLNSSSGCLSRFCHQNSIKIKVVPRATSSIPQPMVYRTDEKRLVALWESAPAARRRNAKPSCTERVRQYLEGLDRTGELLPRRAGRPHKIKIAEACGMSRERIYDNPEIAKLIHDFDKREKAGGTATRPIESLRRYLDELTTNGQSLPLWGHHPNKLLIANACGFSRQEFNRDPKLIQALESYAEAEA